MAIATWTVYLARRRRAEPIAKNNPNTNNKTDGDVPKSQDSTDQANNSSTSKSGESSGGVDIAASVSVNWARHTNAASIGDGTHKPTVNAQGDVYARGGTYTCRVEVAPGSEPNNGRTTDIPPGDFQQVSSSWCDGRNHTSAFSGSPMAWPV